MKFDAKMGCCAGMQPGANFIRAEQEYVEQKKTYLESQKTQQDQITFFTVAVSYDGLEQMNARIKELRDWLHDPSNMRSAGAMRRSQQYQGELGQLVNKKKILQMELSKMEEGHIQQFTQLMANNYNSLISSYSGQDKQIEANMRAKQTEHRAKYEAEREQIVNEFRRKYDEIMQRQVQHLQDFKNNQFGAALNNSKTIKRGQDIQNDSQKLSNLKFMQR